EIYFCPDLFPETSLEQITNSLDYFPEIVNISTGVYEKIAYRGSTEGLLAVVRNKNLELNDLELQEGNFLILVAEAPEKLGNIGALLRTADAARVDAVLIANPKTDIFNPNIIRSSVGCVFTTRIAIGTTEQIIDYLQQKKVNIYS